MTSTIIYFTFLTNYIYVILILWHQKKEYKIYLLNLTLASVLSTFCIGYHRDSLSFLSLNSLLFLLLIILPVWLTKKINHSLSEGKITPKALLYAKWRYRITHASIHYWEYLELIKKAFSYDNAPSVISPDEKNKKSFWKEYPVTSSLMIANILFFLWIQIYKNEQGFLAFLNSGVNSFEFVFYQKEYWRFIIAMFLHFDYLHLGMNLFGLYCMSPFVEKAYGKATFFVIYFICGFLASLASVFWRSYQITLSMGASGAICGLMGAYFFFFQRKGVSVRWKKHQIFSFWFTVVAFAVIGYFIPQMDNAAHFCGLFSGVFLSYLFKKEKPFLKKILVFLCILGILGSFSIQIYHIIFSSYPSNIKKFTWYKVYNHKDSILFPMPFSWKSEFSLRQRKLFLYTKEKPSSFPVHFAHFWDVYHLSRQGELCVKASLSSESFRAILKKDIEDIFYQWQKKQDKKSFTMPSLKQIGAKEYYHREEKKVDIIYSSYFFRHKTSLYQWEFAYPEKQKKQYDDLIQKILKQVDCF